MVKPCPAVVCGFSPSAVSSFPSFLWAIHYPPFLPAKAWSQCSCMMRHACYCAAAKYVAYLDALIMDTSNRVAGATVFEDRTRSGVHEER